MARNPDDHLPMSEAMFQVLVSLADGGKHGYSIMKDIADRTEDRCGSAPERSTGL
jgi:DNA-binding PadR family transcriptional regulator